MHGLINRSFQNYIIDGYGRDAWLDVATLAGVSPPEFEAMIRNAGFVRTRVERILGGAVNIHSGWKV